MSTQNSDKEIQSSSSSMERKKAADEAFYIGWMAHAPKVFVRFIKGYLFFLLPVVMVLAALLALSQKKFGKGNFEFGTLTEIKGVYFDKPVPNIVMMNGKDIWGNENIMTVPLIGYGKHGAEEAIADIEKEKNTSFNGKELTIKGTLLYNDGKLLVQIDKNDNPITKISSLASSFITEKKDLGSLEVKGEIIDPKCFFGVMKPGEGKPHKDCAIRCILGGMPPMLLVRNEKNEANYYLIVGANGERMNDAVKDFVAEPVALHAKAIQYNDWVVLFVDANDGIKRYSYLEEHFGAEMAQCSAASMK